MILVVLIVMATASDSPSAPVQSVNSVLDRHSPKETPEPEIFVYEGTATASFLAEDGQQGSENDGVTKKRVWNKPANGVAPEVGSVMGAASWPALSKSARASTKASSTDSLKELSHGSITLSKEVVNSIVSATNSASNHESPRRQWSPELGGGSSSHRNITANGSFSQAPNSQSSVVEASPFNPVKSSSSSGVSPMDNTHRDVGQRGESHSGHEPHHPRGPFRWKNSGPQVSKRDQERWKHRSFGSRPFTRVPVSSAPFIPPPPPVTPVFYNDTSSFMYYDSGPHPASLGHMPMFTFAPMLYPMPDPHLPFKILTQIDYYFSDDNLVKDIFLRQNMDRDGWVPINLIANFKKIREMTDNVQLILDALRVSNLVEIQGEKVRRKGNWRKWIIPTILYPTGSSLQSLNISSLHIHDEKPDA